MNPLYLAVGVTLTASNAFMLPVSTPSNAIVYTAGGIRYRSTDRGSRRSGRKSSLLKLYKRTPGGRRVFFVLCKCLFRFLVAIGLVRPTGNVLLFFISGSFLRRCISEQHPQDRDSNLCLAAGRSSDNSDAPFLSSMTVY